MADLTNNSAETLDFAEAYPKAIGQAFAEAVDLNSFYPATPYFIGSDLGVYNVAMSASEVAEFMRSRAPLGYSPFRDFVAGEYRFQKAYVSFTFKPLDGADAQLTLLSATVNADVPDKIETNSATVTNASTGISITFATAFSAAPRVTVTPISSTTPVIAVLTASPTSTGFTVKLFDLSGTAVTGSFIWTAVGY